MKLSLARLKHQQEVELVMKRTMKVMLAMMFAATITSSASALDTIYFTPSPTDGTLGTQTFSFGPSLTNQTLYLWSTNGTSVSPDNTYQPGFPSSLPPTTSYFSYDLGLSATSNVNLTAAQVSNFNILSSRGLPLTRDPDWDDALTTPGHPTAAATVTRWNAASSFT